jgi:hypothetical protein
VILAGEDYPMTEAEWLAGDDQVPLLRHLGNGVSDRKLRLFAVACCRRLPPVGEELAGILATCERFADGEADEAELERACHAATEAILVARDEAVRSSGLMSMAFAFPATAVAMTTVAPDRLREFVKLVPRSARLTTVGIEGDEGSERRAQVAILHDLVGNPFRPITLDSAWLRHLDGGVRSFAEAVYADRRFDALPVLADLLEEAGCAEQAVLDHFRSPGPHHRGCWALDLVLGKE